VRAHPGTELLLLDMHLPDGHGLDLLQNLRLEGHHPDAIAEHLAAREIFAWSGHFYAVEVIARLGLEEAGGLVRVGLCHYSTADEVDRLIAALREL
jgi:selenocysteine lyase/cysteine desulfurase